MNLFLPIAFLPFRLHPLLQTDDWARPASVRAVGTERFLGTDETPLTIEASNGMLAFTTQRGLGGSLFGIRRREVSGPRGVFTWLPSASAGASGWCLELPGLSTDYYGSLLLPNRYPRRMIAGQPEALGRSLGKKVIPKPAEQVAGQECIALIIADKTLGGAQQWLWIDRETGITLKRKDIAGTQEDYAYSFTKFVPGSALSNTEFDPPIDFHILRGIPSPEILQHASEKHTVEDYQTDLRKVGARLKNSDGAWLRRVETPKEFAYIQTVVRERKVTRPNRPHMSGQSSGPEVMPGGLPPGWNVSGQISMDGKAIMLNFLTPQGQGPRALIPAPEGTSSSSFSMTIGEENKPPDVALGYVAYLAPDGALVIAPGSSASEAEERRQKMREEEGGGSTIVQSDFLDRTTGDTISYIQSRGRRPGYPLTAFTLMTLPPLHSAKLGDVHVMTGRKPYPLNALTWQAAGAEQTLASTRLTVEQLLHLAESETLVRQP